MRKVNNERVAQILADERRRRNTRNLAAMHKVAAATRKAG